MRAFGGANHWRGVAAVTLAGAGAAIAVVYAVMAMLVLRREN